MRRLGETQTSAEIIWPSGTWATENSSPSNSSSVLAAFRAPACTKTHGWCMRAPQQSLPSAGSPELGTLQRGQTNVVSAISVIPLSFLTRFSPEDSPQNRNLTLSRTTRAYAALWGLKHCQELGLLGSKCHQQQVWQSCGSSHTWSKGLLERRAWSGGCLPVSLGGGKGRASRDTASGGTWTPCGFPCVWPCYCPPGAGRHPSPQPPPQSDHVECWAGSEGFSPPLPALFFLNDLSLKD